MAATYTLLKSAFGNPLVSVLVGAAITWLVAWHYYKKAGDDLRAKAAQLQMATDLILRWLEARGMNVAVIRQPDGTPSGLAHSVSVTDSLEVGDSADPRDARDLKRGTST